MLLLRGTEPEFIFSNVMIMACAVSSLCMQNSHSSLRLLIPNNKDTEVVLCTTSCHLRRQDKQSCILSIISTFTGEVNPFPVTFAEKDPQGPLPVP